jgi:hypothetical protein
MKSKNNKSVFGFKTNKLSRQEEEKKKKLFFKNSKNNYPKIPKKRKMKCWRDKINFKGIIFQVFFNGEKIYSEKLNLKEVKGGLPKNWKEKY